MLKGFLRPLQDVGHFSPDIVTEVKTKAIGPSIGGEVLTVKEFEVKVAAQEVTVFDLIVKEFVIIIKDSTDVYQDLINVAGAVSFLVEKLRRLLAAGAGSFLMPLL